MFKLDDELLILNGARVDLLLRLREDSNNGWYLRVTRHRHRDNVNVNVNVNVRHPFSTRTTTPTSATKVKRTGSVIPHPHCDPAWQQTVDASLPLWLGCAQTKHPEGRTINTMHIQHTRANKNAQVVATSSHSWLIHGVTIRDGSRSC